MKKIVSIALILTLIFTLAVFPIGCELLDSLIGSKPTVPTPPNNTDESDKTDATYPPDNAEVPDGEDNGNTQPPIIDEDDFQDYGMNVITVELDNANVKENGIYNTMEAVGAYIYLYNKLPSNYYNDVKYVKRNYTSSNKLSYTGGTFYNREGLLPKASGRTFTECDIDYRGTSQRNSLRIVFSSDGLIFYTSDHYASFSIMRFV